MKAVASVAAVVALVCVVLLRPGMAQAPVPSSTPTATSLAENATLRTVTVTGYGQMTVAPDQALVRLGVQSEAGSAGEALRQNNASMQALLNSLTDAGVTRADIQTQSIQLFPRYADPQPNVLTATQRIVAYSASNVVEVRVRDLNSLGDLLDAAVAGGGNTIENVRFVVSDSSARMGEARTAAVEDARRKAQQLVALTGAQLGEVLTINETNMIMPPSAAQAPLPNAGGAVPVEAGMQSLDVQVQVTWRLRGGGEMFPQPGATVTTTAEALLPLGTMTATPVVTSGTRVITAVTGTVTPRVTSTPLATPLATPIVTTTATVTATASSSTGSLNARSPSLTLRPRSGPAGTQLVVQAGGLPANAMVRVSLGKQASDFDVVSRGRTDSRGYISMSLSLPDFAQVNENWRVVVTTIDAPVQRVESDAFTVTD